jgi:peptidoglycan/xylan/chitin deacetylase (PgdA/CDA1 family)
VVYLTFDDGPSRYTPQILAILGAHGAHATFFMLGHAAQDNPLRARAVIAAGDAVGNHTWNHPDLRHLSDEAILTQLHRTRAVLPLGAGSCFRPPYGATNAHVRNLAARYGYRQMLWNVDPRDWSRPGSNVVFKRVISKVHDGSVVLLHDGGGNRSGTVAAVRRFVAWRANHGYVMESLPACR